MAVREQSIESITDKLTRYAKMLSTVPNHVPLMAPGNDPIMLYQKQIQEAFLYQSCILSAQTIADIGTGSGFPGVTLALLNPDKVFRLIDRRKNCFHFLEKVVNSLQINNIELHCLRAEELSSQKWRVEAVVARAVSRIEFLLFWSKPILLQNGRVILGKGLHYKDEIHQTKSNAFHLESTHPQPFGSILVYRLL